MICVPNVAMSFDFLREKLDLRWVEDFRGALFVPEEFRAESMSKDHVGVALGWSGFIGKTCTLSVVVQKPEYLTRRIVQEAFRFPFLDCGCVAVLAMVDSGNDKSIEICRRVGFKPVHRIVGAGTDNNDLIIHQMLRSECRWIRKAH